MAKGKKHLPGTMSGGVLQKILSNNLVIVFTYWLFQSCRYSNRFETFFKVTFTIIVAIPLVFFVHPLVALVLAHTGNALFNGHVPAMLVHMGVGASKPGRFLSYIEKMRNRLMNNTNLEYIYSYGSLSRGNYKPTSDIDIRIVPKKGKWFQCLLLLVKERTYALFCWFPLDVYAFNTTELQQKMRSDELPVDFKPANNKKLYTQQISFEEFKTIFAMKNQL